MSDALVPLRNRQGVVVAEAIVDSDEFDRVMTQGRWSLNAARGGYVYRRKKINGRQFEIKLHRFILAAEPGDPIVDHINRNPLDNRRMNLRFATNQQNSQNRVGRPRATSGYRGVFWDAGVKKWRAQHTLNRKTIYIGIFPVELDAAYAAREWRREHMPFADPEELYRRA